MGAWYNPMTGAYRTRLRRVPTVRRCRHGRVLQSAHWHVHSRRRRVQTVQDRARPVRPTTRAPEPTRKRGRGRTSTATGVPARCSAVTTGRRPRIARTIGRARRHRGSGRAKAAPPSRGRGRPGTARPLGVQGSGDIYAGRDGNVYRPADGGGWETNNGSGGWSPVQGEGAQPKAGQTRAGQTDATNRAGQTGSMAPRLVPVRSASSIATAVRGQRATSARPTAPVGKEAARRDPVRAATAGRDPADARAAVAARDARHRAGPERLNADDPNLRRAGDRARCGRRRTRGRCRSRASEPGGHADASRRRPVSRRRRPDLRVG